MNSKVLHIFLLTSLLLICVWSACGPSTWIVWWFEALPALIALVLLALTYESFRLTNMLYALIWIHCIILLVGGRYTYELVPLGDWARDLFGGTRNHYDRLGHFAQGFIPAIAARELLLRTSPLRPGKWLFALITLSVLGISAAYELIEWWAAAAQGLSPDGFLGSQGDVWDAQKDMLCALVGAVCALLLLSRAHDRALRRLESARIFA